MDDDWCRSMRPGRGPGGSFDDIVLISALKRLDWIDVLLFKPGKVWLLFWQTGNFNNNETMDV